MNRKYIVRHYSHTYIARKVRDDGGQFAYYELLGIHKEYKSRSVGVSMRGNLYVNSRSTNNYTGDIVKKDKNTVVVYNEVERTTSLSAEDEKYLYIGITVILIVAILLMIALI